MQLASFCRGGAGGGKIGGKKKRASSVIPWECNVFLLPCSPLFWQPQCRQLLGRGKRMTGWGKSGFSPSIFSDPHDEGSRRVCLYVPHPFCFPIAARLESILWVTSISPSQLFSLNSTRERERERNNNKPRCGIRRKWGQGENFHGWEIRCKVDDVEVDLRACCLWMNPYCNEGSRVVFLTPSGSSLVFLKWKHRDPHICQWEKTGPTNEYIVLLLFFK